MFTRRTGIIGAICYGAAARAEAIGTVVTGADDTAALSQALDKGGLIQLEPRTYRVSAREGVPDILALKRSNTRLQGVPGSVIECDLIYDGRPQTDLALLAISNPGNILENITLQGVGFRFSRKFSLRGQKPVIYAQQVRGLKMLKCNIQFGTYGTFFRQVEDFEVSDCTYQDTKADGLQGGNMGSHTLGMTIRNGQVLRNLFRRTGDDAIAFGGQLGDGWTKGGNLFISQNDIADMNEDGGGIGLYGVSGASITNNRIHNPASHGMAIVTDTNNKQLNNDHVVASSNTITSDKPPRRPDLVAIYLANRNTPATTSEEAGSMLNRCSISKNTIRVSDRGGIRMQLGVRYDLNPSRFPQNVEIFSNDIEYIGPQGGPFGYEGLHLERCASLALYSNRVSRFPGGQSVLKRVLRLQSNPFPAVGPG